MGEIKIGCQTYPWKMNQKCFAGDVEHMLRSASEAGFMGLEAEIDMLGTFFERPEEARELFDAYKMKLAALVLHQEWEGEEETEKEAVLTGKAISFLQHFPFAKLMVSHHAGTKSRGEGETLKKRRKNLLSCMNQVAARAGEAGIVTCYHPNSAKNSLFRNAKDYQILWEMLEKTNIGYAPDIGHIVNGGMDALEVLKAFRGKIRHVHFKDRKSDGSWAVMGEGAIDYPGIVRYLQETCYGGWIMVEDESPLAQTDSDGVVNMDGKYMKHLFSGMSNLQKGSAAVKKYNGKI